MGPALARTIDDWLFDFLEAWAEKGRLTRFYTRASFHEESWTDDDGAFRDDALRAYYDFTISRNAINNAPNDSRSSPPLIPGRTILRFIANSLGLEPRPSKRGSKRVQIAAGQPANVPELLADILGPYVGPHKRA